jgi:hypothetical protein
LVVAAAPGLLLHLALEVEQDQFYIQNLFQYLLVLLVP